MPRPGVRSAVAKKVAVKETKTAVTTAATKTSGTTTKTTKTLRSKIKVEATAKATATKRKALDEEEDEDAENDPPDEEEEEEEEKKTKKPGRKAKKAKTKAGEDAAMPLAERTAVASLKKAMYIGAHVSSAGGVQNAVANSVQIGGNAFALFLKSQRKWQNPPLAEEARDAFRSLCREHGYDAARHCLPHGSYLVNLAQADAGKAQQAYDNFVDDLRRCEALGIELYNFHPGSTGGGDRGDAVARIAAQLNRAHAATSSVVTLVENMAGGGNVVGSRFEDLRDIIAGVEDKSRVGVCLDTCHAFAAGYDLRSPAAFAASLAEFDRVVGTRYLRAVHLNDSKAPLGGRRDLHCNIGTGFLGLRAFHNLVNHDAFVGLPMVLETPIERKGPDGKTFEDRQVWADEIKLLESLIGMDPEGGEFKKKEKELQARGAAERDRIETQVNKKAAKGDKAPKKKAAQKKSQGRKKKRKDESDEEDEDEDDGHDSCGSA